MPAKRRPYEWDWAGKCDPAKNGYQPFATFSVGCFQWLPKTGVRKGLKRGKVVKRFRGPVSDPESVYQQAAAWCTKRNEEAAIRALREAARKLRRKEAKR